MSDPAPLVAAIRAAPADDAPRLVYADWLDEHGQPERAEFIRVQVELARRDSPELRRREAELLAACHDLLAGPLAAPHLRFRFHRGFPVGFGHTGFFFSDDPGTRSRGTTVLKFHPDGRARYATTTDAPEVFVAAFLWPPASQTLGTYALDALARPVALRVTCQAPEGTLDYRGSLERSALRLRAHARLTDRRFWQRFTHVHIPDAEPSSET